MTRPDTMLTDRLVLASRISIGVAVVLVIVSVRVWLMRLNATDTMDPYRVLVVWGVFNIWLVVIAILLYRFMYRIQSAQKQMVENEQRLVLSEAELRKSNAELEAFLFAIGHDLQEPLRAVQNFGDLLQQRHADSLNGQGQDYVKRMVAGAARMQQLLQACVALSQTRYIEAREWISAEKIVEASLKELDIDCTNLQVADDLPQLYIDKRWGVEAVRQLLSNAVKFKRAACDAEVTIEGYREGSMSGLVVKDRGIGLKPSQSQRIFKLFQRGVGREVDGTGVGLTLVRQIAERHGGTAWAEPRDGGGSAFFLTFSNEESAFNSNMRVGDSL